MHRDPECTGCCFSSNAVPVLWLLNYQAETAAGLLSHAGVEKQWDIKRKILVNFFFLCMEKFKFTEHFKSPGESLPPGTQALGLWEPQAALLAHGERTREKAFSSREHPNTYPCIHAQQQKLCSKWQSKKLAKILTSQTNGDYI